MTDHTAAAQAADPEIAQYNLAEEDRQILALNENEEFFSNTPSNYGFGPQYHSGIPGVLAFARAAHALLSKLRAHVADERTAFSAYFTKLHDLEADSDLVQCDQAVEPYRAWTARAKIARAHISSLSKAIHYPECWDTAAYPTLESAMSALFESFKCSNSDTHASPAGDSVAGDGMPLSQGAPTGAAPPVFEMFEASKRPLVLRSYTVSDVGGAPVTVDLHPGVLLKYLEGRIESAQLAPGLLKGIEARIGEAGAPVAGEAQPSDIDILSLAGQYIQPSPVDVAPQIVNFSRALLSRYAAPQASEAVRILFPTHLRKMWSGGEVQAWLDEHQGVTPPKPNVGGSLARYRKWQAEQAVAPKLAKGCHRSHPHENMSPECEAKTLKARADNAAAQSPPTSRDTAKVGILASDLLDLFLEALPAIQAALRANHKLRAALILARDSHGVSLLTDPPQDAWKARRVDEAIRTALSVQSNVQEKGENDAN